MHRIVCRIRQKWPDVRITLRADSGFVREKIMAWCEANDVDYVLGMARNPRLWPIVEPTLEEARQECLASGEAARHFLHFHYRTKRSWSRSRRVIAKAEYLPKGANPRFIVTSLSDIDAKELCERIYCARGEMENRIKEQSRFERDRSNQQQPFPYQSAPFVLLFDRVCLDQ